MIRKFVEARESAQDRVTLWGSGDASREFIYVDDVARALLPRSNVRQTNGAERADFAPSRPTRKTPNPLYLRALRNITPYYPNDPKRVDNPKVAGSNPAPAIEKAPLQAGFVIDAELALG
jgi:hypothetical protein